MSNIDLWTEKYRPSTLSDIYTNKNILSLLKYFIEIKNIPHIIIHGLYGNGKTSLILSIAQDIFGKNEYKNKIIEFNASDERGISVIRNKIKYFSKKKTSGKTNIPKWKILILDEADTLTTDSQFALRRIVEQYSRITKFCIICNNVDKIIVPLISRCFVIHMPCIEKKLYIENLKNISIKENINYNIKTLEFIYENTKNDMRQGISILQMYSLSNKENQDYNIKKISCIINKKLFNIIFVNIKNKNIKNINLLINYLYNNGYTLIKQLDLFFNYYLKLKIEDDKKYKLILKLCDIEQNLLNNCNEYTQYINLFYYMILIL